MQRNNPSSLPKETSEAFAAQIRANAVFEHLAISVVTGAGVCGGMVFVLSLAMAFFDGAFTIDAVFSAFFQALVLTLLFFLIGFASGAMLITPLYRELEKAKRRSGWPYGAAAMTVAIVAIFLAQLVPAAKGPSMLAVICVLSAAIATSVSFSRRMRPVWAAARAEEASAARENLIMLGE